MTFGQKLKYCRKTFGYTQQELAEKLYVTPRMIGYYEHDHKFPGKDVVINISSLFKVPLEYLLIESVEDPGKDFIEESYSVELNRYKTPTKNEPLRLCAAGGDFIPSTLLEESIQNVISFSDSVTKKVG